MNLVVLFLCCLNTNCIARAVGGYMRGVGVLTVCSWSLWCQERAELELPSNSLLTGTGKWLLGSKLELTCSALAEAAEKPKLLQKKSSTKSFFSHSSFLNFPVPKSDPGAEFVVESCGWWRGKALVINDLALLAGPKALQWLALISCQIVFVKGWIYSSHTVSCVDVR